MRYALFDMVSGASLAVLDLVLFVIPGLWDIVVRNMISYEFTRKPPFSSSSL
jgi:hypothetical protein